MAGSFRAASRRMNSGSGATRQEKRIWIDLASAAPLTVQMSMYGGFEQVGSLGTSLPRNDIQTTTQAGDIVLYSGNQIVVFYGSNSWAYTRLGRITNVSAEGMTNLLANGDAVITLFLEQVEEK